MKKSQITKLKNTCKTLLIIVLGAFVVIPIILMFFNLSTKSFEGMANSVSSPTYSFEFRNDTSANDISDSISGEIVASPQGGATSDSSGIVFNGTSGYVDLSSFSLGGGPMTFETYVKYNNISASAPIFDFGTSNPISMKNDTSYVVFSFDNSGTIETTSSTVVPLTTSWQHLVTTIDPSYIKIYSDGSLKTTYTTTGGVPSRISRTSQLIGKSTTSFLHGTVGYFRIWDGTALQSGDVTSLYTDRASKNLFVTTGVSGEGTVGPSGEECSTDTIRCVANNGTKLGEPLCCGQTGVVNDIAYNCPIDLPYCVDYTCGGEWGKCVSENPDETSSS